MDEFNRRTLERIREAESSAFGINKRRMLEAVSPESAHARAALNAVRYAESAHARGALDAVRNAESAHVRAALDAVRNMPDFSRSAIDAMKNLSAYSHAIERTVQATPFLNAIGEAERQIATRYLHAITESERQIATRYLHDRESERQIATRYLHDRESERQIATRYLHDRESERQIATRSLHDRESERQIATRFQQERAEMVAASRIAIESFRSDALQKALSTFDRLNAVQLGSIAGSARLAALSFTNPALESAFSANAFANQVADSIRNALQPQVFDPFAFDGLEELIEEKIADLPRDKVTAQGLYRIIFDIVIVLFAVAQTGGLGYDIYAGAEQAEEQNKQQIAIAAQQDARSAQVLDFLKQVGDNTAKMVPENDPGKYYVVERDVVLRVKPRPKAAKIVVLFPNQPVLLVKDNHKWIYIQYFDYLEGIPRYGWAMKKYFRRVV